VTTLLKNDFQIASGCLQTCAGIQGGIEAAVHAMKNVFSNDKCEAILLVDADNAFNRLNRELAIKNIKQTCPVFHQYLLNTYRSPSKLFFNDGSFILSKEGATQGDNSAMPMYALSSRPLIDTMSRNVCDVTQVWFADDATGAGSIESIKKYWDCLSENGPKYGYFPKASKTVLILKNSADFLTSKSIFKDTDIEITCEGQRHLGAVLGSENFKEKYVKQKVSKWIQDVEKLAEVAQQEPQAALCAFTKGLCHRWTYIQRTVSDISGLF
ncbi:MAG: hypothetical protein GY816_23180, partial [Cytophagales bacterium]|nr:hypothetical protein [Cytophagales bacterium]